MTKPVENKELVIDLSEDTDEDKSSTQHIIIELSDEEEFSSEKDLAEDNDEEKYKNIGELTEGGDKADCKNEIELQTCCEKEISPSKYDGDNMQENTKSSPEKRNPRYPEKSLEKAMADITKGCNLMDTSLKYGISADVIHNKIRSRVLPKESNLLTKNEEQNLLKWVLKSNERNLLVFRSQLLDRVGKLKKVTKITPIFAKSKYALRWYRYFLQRYPEIHENEDLLMTSDVSKKQCSNGSNGLSNEGDIDPLEVDPLNIKKSNDSSDWPNKGDIQQFQVDPLKIKKSNDSSDLPNEGDIQLLEVDPFKIKKNAIDWPDKGDIKPFKLDPLTIKNEPTDLLLSYGIKDAVVVLHDYIKKKKSPFNLSEKSEVCLQPTIDESDNTQSEECVTNNPAQPSELTDVKRVCDKSNKIAKDIANPFVSNSQKENIKLRPACNKCNRTFCNKSKLRRHMYTHMSKEHYTLTCNKCSKKFPSKSHLNFHYKYSHSSKYFTCNECNQVFKHSTSLRNHKKRVHENLKMKPKKSIFVCDLCGKLFRYKNSIEAHMMYQHLKQKANHNNTSLFICNICTKVFLYKNSLEAHIMYQHLKQEKKYSCDVCKKQFIKYSALKRHTFRHNKIKPFSCSHCEKTFSRKYLLREHIELYHKPKQRKVDDEECEKISKEYLRELGLI